MIDSTKYKLEGYMGTSINISFPGKYRGRVQEATQYLQQEIILIWATRCT